MDLVILLSMALVGLQLNHSEAFKVNGNLDICNATVPCCDGKITVHEGNNVFNLSCIDVSITPVGPLPSIITSCFSCISLADKIEAYKELKEFYIIFGSILTILTLIIFPIAILLGFLKLKNRLPNYSIPTSFRMRFMGIREIRGNVRKNHSWGALILLALNISKAELCAIPDFHSNHLTMFTLTPSTVICEKQGTHHLIDYNFIYPLVELYETREWTPYSWIEKGCAESNVCGNPSQCAKFGTAGLLMDKDKTKNVYKKFCRNHPNPQGSFDCWFRTWWCWIYTWEPIFGNYPTFKVYRMSEAIVDYKVDSVGSTSLYPEILPLAQHPLSKGVILKNMVNGNLWYCAEYSFSGRPVENQVGDIQFINSTMYFIWKSLYTDDHSWYSSGKTVWPQSFIRSHLSSTCELLTSDYRLRPSELGGQLIFKGSPILGRIMMLGDPKFLINGNVSNHCYNLVTELHGAKRESSHFTVLIKADSYNSSSSMLISSPCFVGVHSINCDGRYNYFLASDISSECMYNGTVVDKSTNYRPFMDEETGSWISHTDWSSFGIHSVLGGSLLTYIVIIVIVVLMVKRR